MRGGRDDPSMARYPSSFSRHTSPHPIRRTPASEARAGAPTEVDVARPGRDSARVRGPRETAARRGFEPAHLSLALSRRLMRNLCAVVLVSVRAMGDGRHDRSVRSPVAAQLVGDQSHGLTRLALQQLTKKIAGGDRPGVCEERTRRNPREGIVRLTAGISDSWHEQRRTELPRLSIPRRHHRLRRLALLSVLAPVAVDRSPSPPRSWAKTAGSPQVHVSDARDRRDGLRQARV